MNSFKTEGSSEPMPTHSGEPSISGTMNDVSLGFKLSKQVCSPNQKYLNYLQKKFLNQNYYQVLGLNSDYYCHFLN